MDDFQVQPESISGGYGFSPRTFFLKNVTSKIIAMGEQRCFPKNHLLFSTEMPHAPNFSILISEGRVAAFSYLKSGVERIYAIYEAGAFFLEEWIFTGRPLPVSYRTLTPCKLIFVGKETLKRALQEDFDVAWDIIELLSAKLTFTREQLYMEDHRAMWKLCDLLRLLAARYGMPNSGGGILITEKFSQQMMSNILGMNRTTVAKLMRQLKERDLVSFDKIDRHYSIPDMERLIAWQERF